MTLKWFQMPLLLTASLSFSHSTQAHFYSSLRIIIIIIIIIIEWSPTSLTRFLGTISGLTAGFDGVNLKQYVLTTLHCFTTW
jgi:hypothetical protein